MTRPYRPCNGSEGGDFITRWCDRCQCEPENIEEDEQEGCPILTATFVLCEEDAEYPPEWIEDENGPRCTAFIERVEIGIVADPHAVAKARAAYDALPRDPISGRPVIA